MLDERRSPPIFLVPPSRFNMMGDHIYSVTVLHQCPRTKILQTVVLSKVPPPPLLPPPLPPSLPTVVAFSSAFLPSQAISVSSGPCPNVLFASLPAPQQPFSALTDQFLSPVPTSPSHGMSHQAGAQIRSGSSGWLAAVLAR